MNYPGKFALRPVGLIIVSVVLLVLSTRAQVVPEGVPTGPCKVWVNGVWVEEPCRDDSAPPRTRDPLEDSRQKELEAEQKLELQREREKAERKRKAAEADRKGMAAVNRGDWKMAADFFIQALEFSPGNQEIRAHLDRANIALADAAAAQDILALRRRIEDAIAAATVESWRQEMEEDFAVQRINAMLESFHSENIKDRAVKAGTGGTKATYPVFLGKPVSPNSAPAKVLAQYQPKIMAIDEKICQVQTALGRLITSNTKSEEQRLEWTQESLEATTEAQDLAVGLLIDLIGARVDYLTGISNKERAVVLNQLSGRNDRRSGFHTAYGMLLDRKDELERIQSEVRLAGKTNDLRIRIRDFSMDEDKKFTHVTFWEVISQIKKVENLTGPFENLTNAVYTIYRQAASLERLAVTQANQEKTLQSAAVLRRYIVKLVAQKKGSVSRVSCGKRS